MMSFTFQSNILDYGFYTGAEKVVMAQLQEITDNRGNPKKTILLKFLELTS